MANRAAIFTILLPTIRTRPGKMMRPSLCVAVARTFGASLDEVLPTAAAIELLHNALLIHDDIEDESESRRGQPSLNALHGVPLALNAGDLLLLTSLRPLLENWRTMGPELASRIFDEAVRTARETAEGQAIELGWRAESNAPLRDANYLEMVLKKTCWLASIYPMRAGALIGTRGTCGPGCLYPFRVFSRRRFSDPGRSAEPRARRARYGKERDGDLMEGKRTLMMIRLLQEAAPANALNSSASSGRAGPNARASRSFGCGSCSINMIASTTPGISPRNWRAPRCTSFRAFMRGFRTPAIGNLSKR